MTLDLAEVERLIAFCIAACDAAEGNHDDLPTPFAEALQARKDALDAYVQPLADALRVAIAELAGVTKERDSLLEVKERHLALIAKITNETPFPAEMQGWTDQRAKLVAEVGTLRARVTELEAENVRHRATALPADANTEQVRAVVQDCIFLHLASDNRIVPEMSVGDSYAFADAIADRAAAQLATAASGDPHRGCPVHFGSVHGSEAEELRKGVEVLIARDDEHVPSVDLIRLLDSIDARDSLAFLERSDTATGLTAERDELRCQVARLTDAYERAAARRREEVEQLRADSGRHARRMTYRINDDRGEHAAGIPSLDAAISIAVDAAQYYDARIEQDEDGLPLAAFRQAVEVLHDQVDEDFGRTYTLIRANGRDEFGIVPEHRCPTCNRPGWKERA